MLPQITTFYLDESGHSGDMLNRGKRCEFEEQPFFVLAAVGIEDEEGLKSRIAELREQHGIASVELQSKSLHAKPKFITDLIAELLNRRVPLFVELVDKRYFICAYIATFQLLPPLMGFQEGPCLAFVRNTVADLLYAEASDQTLDAFVFACMTPSEITLILSFTQLWNLGLACLHIQEKRYSYRIPAYGRAGID